MRMRTFYGSMASIAALGAVLWLAAPARAQVVCQKSKGSKLTFKLRESCKVKEAQTLDLGTQPAGFLRRQTGTPCLQDAGGALAAVFPEFELPPGEWLLQGKADVVNLTGSVGDYFRCVITVDGQPVDGATAYLTNLQVGNLALIAHASGGAMVGLACSHDSSFDNSLCGVFQGEGAYVEGARLSGANLRSFSEIPVP
jgi:hypothetical protein